MPSNTTESPWKNIASSSDDVRHIGSTKYFVMSLGLKRAWPPSPPPSQSDGNFRDVVRNNKGLNGALKTEG